MRSLGERDRGLLALKVLAAVLACVAGLQAAALFHGEQSLSGGEGLGPDPYPAAQPTAARAAGDPAGAPAPAAAGAPAPATVSSATAPSAPGVPATAAPPTAGPQAPGAPPGAPAPGAPALPPLPEKYRQIDASGIFGKQPRKEIVPTLVGIAGRYAVLLAPDGQTGLVAEGGELGGMKLLKIGQNRVLIEYQGKTQELVLFGGLGSESLLNPPATPERKEKSP